MKSSFLFDNVWRIITVLIGTVVTVLLPYDAWQHEIQNLKNLTPYTALQLAGRDLYQKEGCVNCHTQTVRPLKAEVLRYGDYSKTGEFYLRQTYLYGGS